VIKLKVVLVSNTSLYVLVQEVILKRLKENHIFIHVKFIVYKINFFFFLTPYPRNHETKYNED
jgi:hypothetical protein